MAIQQFEHPRTGAIINFEWDSPDPPPRKMLMKLAEAHSKEMKERGQGEGLERPNFLATFFDPSEMLTMGAAGGVIGALKGGAKAVLPSAVDWATYGLPKLAKNLYKFPGAVARGFAAKNVEKAVPPAATVPVKIDVPVEKMKTPTSLPIAMRSKAQRKLANEMTTEQIMDWVKNNMNDPLAKILIGQSKSPQGLQGQTIRELQNRMFGEVGGPVVIGPKLPNPITQPTSTTRTSEPVIALRQGPVGKHGAYFSTEGGSTYYDLENPNALKYDISNTRLVTSDTEEMGQVLKTALKSEKNKANRKRIEEALDGNFVDYKLYDEVSSVQQAARRHGYDGVKLWENDDVGSPSSVNIWNLHKVKEVGARTLPPTSTKVAQTIRELSNRMTGETGGPVVIAPRMNMSQPSLPPIPPHPNFPTSYKAAQEGVGELLDPLERLLHSSGDYVRRFVKELEGAKRIVPDYKVGTYQVPERVVPHIPQEVPGLPRRDIPLASITTKQSPHHVLDRVFALKDNPVYDALESSQAYIKNNKNSLAWARDVLKGTKDSSREVARELGPVFQRHAPVIEKVNKLEDTLADIRTNLAKLPNETGPEAKKLVEARDKITAELKQIRATELAPLHADHAQAIMDLARKYSDVRIYLSAANELPEGLRLSPNEVEAAARLKNYMEQTRGQLQKVGIPVITDKAYMPRVMEQLLQERPLSTIYNENKHVPGLLAFVSRVPGARTWFPSAHAALEAYIPTVEFKLAYQPFLNRWNKVINTTQQPQLRAYLQQWRDSNIFAKARTLPQKGLDSLVSLEYMKLIGGSLSVGVKHLTKLAGTWSVYGAESTGKGMYELAKVPVQGMMKRFGLEGDYNALKAFRVYVNAKQLAQTLDEIPTLQQAGSVFKRIVGQPVTAIEAFDNGVSVFAGIIKGMGRNVPVQQIERSIWETILNANFRAGWDQPLWQKGVVPRAVSMFQLTPYKLGEYKLNLIEKALKGEKDGFGTHYSTMIARYAVIVGAAEAIARKNGTSLLEMFFHVPFFRDIEFQKKFPFVSAKFGGSPLIDLAYMASKEGPVAAIKHELGIKKGGGLKDLARSQMGTTSKVRRILRHDIPKQYESPTRYLLGLPKVHEKKVWKVPSKQEQSQEQEPPMGE